MVDHREEDIPLMKFASPTEGDATKGAPVALAPSHRYRAVEDASDRNLGIDLKLLYQMLSILILSLFIPAVTITVIAASGRELGPHEMICLLIFSAGCPFVGIMTVSCVLLWRYEYAKMEEHFGEV